MKMIAVLSEQVNKLVEWLLFSALAAMTVVITIQIVFRVFFDALTWSEEVSRYLLVWSSFLGASVGFKRGGHIAVTFFVDLLKGMSKKFVQALTILCSEAFFIVGAFYGFKLIQMQVFQISPALGLPMKYVYLVIPVSMLVMALHALADLVQLFERREAQ